MIAKLNCPNCGAALTLTEDIERFACAYCGAGLIQERKGGAIVLRAITEAISLVQQGTDKTAAELALQRYESKRAALLSKRKALEDLAQASSRGCAVWGLASVGLMLIAAGQTWLGLGALAIAGVMAWFSSNTTGDIAKQRRAIDQELAALEERIAEKERVADGAKSGAAADRTSPEQ